MRRLSAVRRTASDRCTGLATNNELWDQVFDIGGKL
jgi:hypothetical protein